MPSRESGRHSACALRRSAKQYLTSHKKQRPIATRTHRRRLASPTPTTTPHHHAVAPGAPATAARGALSARASVEIAAERELGALVKLRDGRRCLAVARRRPDLESRRRHPARRRVRLGVARGDLRDEWSVRRSAQFREGTIGDESGV